MFHRTVLTVAIAILSLGLAERAAMAADDSLPAPGQVVPLAKPGAYQASPGDLLVVDLKSNPSTGPYNPAANLRAKVEGTAVRAVTVVFVPPAKPMPGAPGRIQAYFVAQQPGPATLVVTPIQGNGQPGQAMEFKVVVATR